MSYREGRVSRCCVNRGFLTWLAEVGEKMGLKGEEVSFRGRDGLIWLCGVELRDAERRGGGRGAVGR